MCWNNPALFKTQRNGRRESSQRSGCWNHVMRFVMGDDLYFTLPCTRHLRGSITITSASNRRPAVFWLGVIGQLCPPPAWSVSEALLFPSEAARLHTHLQKTIKDVQIYTITSVQQHNDYTAEMTCDTFITHQENQEKSFTKTYLHKSRRVHVQSFHTFIQRLHPLHVFRDTSLHIIMILSSSHTTQSVTHGSSTNTQHDCTCDEEREVNPR